MRPMAALSLPIAWPTAGEVGGWWDPALCKGGSMVGPLTVPSQHSGHSGRTCG